EDLDIQVSDSPTHSPNTSRTSDSYRSGWTEDVNNDGEPDDEPQWICDVLGVQLGPMPLSDLQLLARKGEVGLDDPVRRADETEWQPAKTVEGLFPGFEYHSDVGLPEVASSSPPMEDLPSHALPMIGDDFNLAIDDLSSAEIPQAPADLRPPPQPVPVAKQAPQPPTTEPPPQPPTPVSPVTKSVSPEEEKRAKLDKWLSDAVPSPPPPIKTETAATRDQPETPRPTPSNEDRAAQLKAEFEARAAATRTFTPPTPQKKTGSTGPGMGDQLSDLMGKLKGNPKVLGVLAVLGLVALLKFMPWSFGPSNQGTLDTVKTIGSTFKEMRTRKASPTEFDSFKKESLEKIKPLKSALLDAGAGINDRPKQELYWACGKLEKMLNAGIGGEPDKDEKAYERHIATAQALINGEPPPPPPPEEGDE
ncbi:MAG: DUF4339 domain-containing protein, partial [Planctomycetaceae bacterium]|nr:DUF4339 domain-containing protein [Planctomycetaceae bacterium]